MFGEITVIENWRKRYNGEIMQLFGDLDVLPFVRTSRLNWIGRVNRMESKRKVSEVLNNNNNNQESRPRGRRNTVGGTVNKRILIGAKLKIGKNGQKQR